MTERFCFESCLVELNKVQAPAILLDDFNYLFRKAIQKYFNKRYNLFEKSQQLTDDLRVLIRTKKLAEGTVSNPRTDLTGNSFKYNLPNDYVHVLNCICEFTDTDCKGQSITVQQGANKLNTSERSTVITNYYMRPSKSRPYYYITNIEQPVQITSYTEPRYGNSYIPTIEILCGTEKPSGVFVEYLCAPKWVELQQEDLDKIQDDTDELEFPDYVIYEIINEIVTSCMENSKDNRIQTFPAVNTTLPQK